MMKNQWKRVAALLMMVALLFAFSAPALAASQTSGTFTLHLKQKPTPEPEKESEATEQPAEAPKPTEEPQVTEAPAAETTEEPAEEIKWVVGEKGNIVLDASGNPIPANTIPEGAQKLATLVDKISPDRTIDIYAVHEGKYLTYGDEVTLGRKRPWKSMRTAARRRCWTRVSTRFARMTRRRERWSCRPMRTIAAIMRDSAR